jgi:hypothetical protein
VRYRSPDVSKNWNGLLPPVCSHRHRLAAQKRFPPAANSDPSGACGRRRVNDSIPGARFAVWTSYQFQIRRSPFDEAPHRPDCRGGGSGRTPERREHFFQSTLGVLHEMRPWIVTKFLLPRFLSELRPWFVCVVARGFMVINGYHICSGKLL